jgi:two-component system chemotaxis response regulator CheY
MGCIMECVGVRGRTMAYKFQNISVLVVENSGAMYTLVKDILVTFGIKQIYSAFDVEKGFEVFRRENPDIIITDWLGDSNGGLALIKQIRTDNRSPDPFASIILMTGFTHESKVLAARDAGVSEILVKPYTVLGLYGKIEDLIEKPRAFVKTSSFLGPDRRHKKEATRAGIERRVRKPVSIETQQ